jgi:hypothetical protein
MQNVLGGAVERGAVEILCRVHAILMPLEAECDLGLALSAEANDLIQVLIRLRFRFVDNGRQNHFVPLLQNRVRFNLVHEAAFAFKSVTYWTSHIAFYCRLFYAAVKGERPKRPLRLAAAVSFLTLPVKEERRPYHGFSARPRKGTKRHCKLTLL